MRGKFWSMLLWLCLILGKYLAANVKKGYLQVGNELLQKDIPVSLFNFSALVLILNRFVRF